jgi:hypothetical protein
MAIGSIVGIAEDTAFASRRELYDAGIHRALQAGIVGSASTGAESIILSGGYVDDQDLGNEIIYTGHGGRDTATGRQLQIKSLPARTRRLSRHVYKVFQCGLFADPDIGHRFRRRLAIGTRGSFKSKAIGTLGERAAF